MSSKAREALLAVYDCAKDGVLTIRESAFEKVLEALKEPVRNRDVGTADELYTRFKSYCDDNVAHDKLYCQTTCCSFCVMEWMQMPYEAATAEDKQS